MGRLKAVVSSRVRSTSGVPRCGVPNGGERRDPVRDAELRDRVPRVEAAHAVRNQVDPRRVDRLDLSRERGRPHRDRRQRRHAREQDALSSRVEVHGDAAEVEDRHPTHEHEIEPEHAVAQHDRARPERLGSERLRTDRRERSGGARRIDVVGARRDRPERRLASTKRSRITRTDLDDRMLARRREPAPLPPAPRPKRGEEAEHAQQDEPCDPRDRPGIHGSPV